MSQASHEKNFAPMIDYARSGVDAAKDKVRGGFVPKDVAGLICQVQTVPAIWPPIH
jgi:hypothetical protein